MGCGAGDRGWWEGCRVRGTAWGLWDEEADATARFQELAEEGWGLETAEREEELGFWQTPGVLGKEIKSSVQINRNKGKEATSVFLPH